MIERLATTIPNKMKVVLVTFAGTLINFAPLSLAQTPPEQRLIPFTSDGCSSAPNTIFGESLMQCCVAHDLKYWKGGTEIQKFRADIGLFRCVREKTKNSLPLLADVYEAAVDTFGGPVYLGGLNNPFSWRWGYGWQKPREFKALTSQEKFLLLQDLMDMKTALTQLDRSKPPVKIFGIDFRTKKISPEDRPSYDTINSLLDTELKSFNED